VPEWQGTDHEGIQLRHLLTMTSGLEWSAFSDYVSMATFSQDHTAYALDLSLDKQPGEEWTYHNGAVQILEPVFRGATGMTIEAYAAEHLWGPLGMEATWAHDPGRKPDRICLGDVVIAAITRAWGTCTCAGQVDRRAAGAGGVRRGDVDTFAAL
jgi:CubicO group peptidase (beta-lactamase class C family)